jgi:hypothetical protein
MWSGSITGVDRVEISGWDEQDVFFVEKTRLAWDGWGGQHVSLRPMLRDGAIVFLRALPSIAQKQAPPAVYKVEFIGCDAEGLHQYRLSSVHPRYGEDAVSVN